MKKTWALICFAACIVLLGILAYAWYAGISFIVRAISDENDRQFFAPGKTEIVIAEPRRYELVMYTYAIVDGKVYSCDDHLPEGATISIFNVTENIKIEANKTSGMSSQSNGERSQGMVSFELARPATVSINIEGDFEPRLFSVSTSFLDIFLKIAILGGGTIIGFVLIMILGGAGLILLFYKR